MKKTILCISLVVLLTALLTGCCLLHEWVDATCTAPKTCANCGETEGEPLGHEWVDATCTSPKTCANCGETEGEPLGHSKGEWELVSKPKNGAAGTKTLSCTICDNVIETKEFFYPYFNMSFEEFVKRHNNAYASNGWTIREVDTGFSYFMNSSEETAIIFHSDLNGKSSGSATAYSTKKLTKFNELQVRIIDYGASAIDTDIMATVLMVGGAITQPLGSYELSTFLDEFLDNWVVTISSSSFTEGEATVDGYKYILRAYTVDGYYSSVYYEWICQAT